MRRQTLLAATAAALLSIGLPSLVRAQDDDPEVTAMAKQHFKLGLDAYNGGKYDLAIKELKKAYLLKRIPAILLNIGLTYRKTKDYDMAVYFYKKYLGEAPPDDKQRPAAEAAIKEIEDEKAAAAKEAEKPAAKPAVEAAPAKPAAKPAAPAAPGAPAGAPAVSPAAPAQEGAAAASAPVTEWSHTPIDAAPPGKPVDVRVQMPVMKGVKVKVFFRKEGQASFDSLELKRRGNEKVARLPEGVTSGRTFQYYVEARDTAGTLVKSSGSEASPNIVLVDPGARPQVAGAEAEGPDDEELAARQKKGFTRDIENESATLGDQQKAMARLRDQMKGEEDRNKKPAALGTLGKVGVGLMAGGGLSLAGGLTLLGLAQSWGELVTQDWECQNKVRPPGGVSQCPHFGGNDQRPGYALNPPSASYDAQGRTFNDAGLGLTIAGGVVLAAGTGLLVADVIKRQSEARAAAQPKAKPGKKRKVKKVIEVEEEVSSFNLAPVISPTTLGVVGELRF